MKILKSILLLVIAVPLLAAVIVVLINLRDAAPSEATQSALAEAQEIPDPLPASKMPVINCNVVTSTGSFLGYMPPETGFDGDIDLGRLVEKGDAKLVFTREPPPDSGKKRGEPLVGYFGYIPLPENYETVRNWKYYDEKTGEDRLAFFEVVFTSENGDIAGPRWEVMLQVTPVGLDGYRAVAIQKSHGVIDSFAMMNCSDTGQAGPLSDDGINSRSNQ